MSEKRFFTKVNKNGRNVIIDKECHIEIIDLTLACEVLNRLDLKLKHYNEVNGEQQSSIQELERKLKKYAKIGEEQLKQIIELQETETFTFPPNCDEYDFLGNNGVCGYCKFTLKCYDSKEDLIDGEVLPNCPLKPLINVLNEQQSTIQSLKEDKAIAEDYANIFEKENVKLRKQIDEQQATISALKEENEQLRAINKKIGDDLYNCRLNKNIIREKLKLWQDVHKEYDIYSIKDFEELMKNDK